MIRDDAGTTSPTLLNRLDDWRDHQAWLRFKAQYDPFIRGICAAYRLDNDATEELCQYIWVRLAYRMRTFRYDPGKTFRGWLRRFCNSRAIDFLRKKKKLPKIQFLDDQWAASLAADSESEPENAAEHPALFALAEDAQRAVRARVDERTWGVFWSIAVDNREIRETATEAGMTYYAAFAAQKRVNRMLRETGERLLAERGS